MGGGAVGGVESGAGSADPCESALHGVVADVRDIRGELYDKGIPVANWGIVANPERVQGVGIVRGVGRRSNSERSEDVGSDTRGDSFDGLKSVSVG